MNQEGDKAATWVVEFIKSSGISFQIVFFSKQAEAWWESVIIFSGFGKLVNPTQAPPPQTAETNTPSGKGDESTQGEAPSIHNQDHFQGKDGKNEDYD